MLLAVKTPLLSKNVAYTWHPEPILPNATLVAELTSGLGLIFNRGTDTMPYTCKVVHALGSDDRTSLDVLLVVVFWCAEVYTRY